MTHLEAWINNQRVGTFEDVDGSIEFSYAPNYQGIPVSLRLRPDHDHRLLTVTTSY